MNEWMDGWWGDVELFPFGVVLDKEGRRKSLDGRIRVKQQIERGMGIVLISLDFGLIALKGQEGFSEWSESDYSYALKLMFLRWIVSF